MRILWTAGSKPIPRLIRWVSGKDCSHVAIVFNGCLVFHSTLADGVHVQWISSFLKQEKLVHEREIEMSVEYELSIYKQIISENVDREYDKLILWKKLWFYLLKRLGFNVDESKCELGDKKKDVCTEVAKRVLKDLGYSVPNHIIEPHDLWDYIESQPEMFTYLPSK